jgi:hypothetical protein
MDYSVTLNYLRWSIAPVSDPYNGRSLFLYHWQYYQFWPLDLPVCLECIINIPVGFALFGVPYKIEGAGVGWFVTPRNGVLLEKLVVSHSIKKFALSHGTRCSLSSSQHALLNAILHTAHFLKIVLTFSPLYPYLPKIFSSLRVFLTKTFVCFYFNALYRASFIILCNDQPMHNYFTNYHTAPTCFDTVVSSSGSS